MTRATYYVAVAALTLGLALHAASYLPFFYDDAFISLRYAQRLIDGEGLTWTAGERVEGYSDLLWVLLCAGLGALGVDLVDAARALGVASAIATMGAVAYAGRAVPKAGALALAFVAASGSFAVWAVAGLEATLLAALVAWGTTLLLGSSPDAPLDRRKLLGSGVLFALAALTRPDAPLFLSGGIAMLIAERRARRLPELALPTVLAVLAQLAFRWTYYADIVPNSTHVKLALTASRAYWGARYVGAGLLEAGGLVVLGGVALALGARVKALRPRTLAIAVPLLLWAAYLVSIGGDPIPARRHFVPLVALLALAIVQGGHALPGLAIARSRVIGASCLCLLAFVVVQLRAPEMTQVRDETWEWDGRTLGQVLHTAFGERAPLVAVDPAGCVPYYSRLPSLDMLGLNDRHIGSAPVPDFGGGPIGHERGDGAYVLDRHPDLVLFCGPAGALHACFRSGRQMERDPRFENDYRAIVVVNDAPALRTVLFARLESSTIGLTTTSGEVRVPAYFFASGSPHVAALDRAGTLALRLSPHVPVTLHRVPMPARGSWTGAPSDATHGVSVTVPSVYPTPEGLRADVVLSASESVELAAITLRR